MPNIRLGVEICGVKGLREPRSCTDASLIDSPDTAVEEVGDRALDGLSWNGRHKEDTHLHQASCTWLAVVG